MAWEQAPNRKKFTDNTIAVSQCGAVILNPKLISVGEKVNIFFDVEEKKIMIQPAKDGTHTVIKNGGSNVVSAAHAVRRVTRMPYAKYCRYPYEIVGGAIVLDMSKGDR